MDVETNELKNPDTRRLVVVALVVVAFDAVKFWRVVEPVARRVLVRSELENMPSE